jgi:hypothetical protein
VNLLLIRHAYLPVVTLGTLLMDGLELATLEEPWIPNPHGPGGARKFDGRESCVPDGTYILKPHSGARFQNVWRLSNHELGVFDAPTERKDPSWGRVACLIHAGNTTRDIEGCILVGLRHGEMAGQAAVYESQKAVDKLRVALGQELHQLEIRPSGGTGGA